MARVTLSTPRGVWHRQSMGTWILRRSSAESGKARQGLSGVKTISARQICHSESPKGMRGKRDVALVEPCVYLTCRHHDGIVAILDIPNFSLADFPYRTGPLKPCWAEHPRHRRFAVAYYSAVHRAPPISKAAGSSSSATDKHTRLLPLRLPLFANPIRDRLTSCHAFQQKSNKPVFRHMSTPGIAVDPSASLSKKRSTISALAGWSSRSYGIESARRRPLLRIGSGCFEKWPRAIETGLFPPAGSARYFAQTFVSSLKAHRDSYSVAVDRAQVG